LANLQNDLNEFVALLLSEKVEFVVVGGHAVAFHGHPRYTGDIDFLVRPVPANAQNVLVALRKFGFGSLGLSLDDFTSEGQIVQLGLPPNRIDLLTSISGVSFETVWESRILGQLGGHEVPFIGFDALITNKTASDRAKDRADIEVLKSIVTAMRKG
jgi:hypothetical protein